MNDAADGDVVVGSYLDHDHPERIDVRFFADADIPAQNLRRGPPYGVVLVNTRGGFDVRSNGGKPEVRETRTASIVNKNAWLGHQLER